MGCVLEKWTDSIHFMLSDEALSHLSVNANFQNNRSAENPLLIQEVPLIN